MCRLSSARQGVQEGQGEVVDEARQGSVLIQKPPYGLQVPILLPPHRLARNLMLVEEIEEIPLATGMPLVEHREDGLAVAPGEPDLRPRPRAAGQDEDLPGGEDVDGVAAVRAVGSQAAGQVGQDGNLHPGVGVAFLGLVGIQGSGDDPEADPARPATETKPRQASAMTPRPPPVRRWKPISDTSRPRACARSGLAWSGSPEPRIATMGRRWTGMGEILD